MTPDEIKLKIEDLLRRHDAVTNRKAVFQGQLQAKKEELASLIQEIKAAGYDPKKLVAERDKAQQELVTMITKFETDLAAVERALAALDKK